MCCLLWGHWMALSPFKNERKFKDTNTDLTCKQEHLLRTTNQNAGQKHNITVTNVFPNLKKKELNK